MQKIIAATVAATVAATTLALVPAGFVSANNGNDNGRGACVQLGQIHKGLATQGLIPGTHLPGSHTGMAGLCFGED